MVLQIILTLKKQFVFVSCFSQDIEDSGQATKFYQAFSTTEVLKSHYKKGTYVHFTDLHEPLQIWVKMKEVVVT